MRYKLGKSSHSVYSLQYHLILVIAQEPSEDHIHILFKAKPTTNLVRVINVLKGVTSRYLRKEFPKVKEYL